jgi:hypothetical protein
MGIRDQDLETTGAVYATFSIKQTAGVDDLKDQDLGKAVQITSGNTIGSATDGSMILGKLVDLSLTDADNGKRVATVQVKGIMTLPITTTYPVVGNRVVGGANGTVKQAPALTGYDPAGGNIARGAVIVVSGTTECTLIL